MTMVLSAMEVGLATKQSQNQEIFLQIATGFAILSILLPFYVMSGIMLACIGYGMRMLWGACSTKNKLPKSICTITRRILAFGKLQELIFRAVVSGDSKFFWTRQEFTETQEMYC